MSLRLYWHSLNREHPQLLSEPGGPERIDQRFNLLLGGLCAFAATFLFTVGGYRAGFEAMHRTGLLLPTPLLDSLSDLGATLPAICLIALLVKRRPRVVWMGVLASVYATLVTHFLKVLCNSARPPAVLGDWAAVTGPILRHYSFPSGHTVTAFLLAACFSVGASPGTRALLYTVAAAAGLSRIWIGVHWPIDVIAGAGIAGLSIALAIRTLGIAYRGLVLVPHLVFMPLVAACAFLELKVVPDYSLAHLVRLAIAAISLVALARDYVFQPLLLARTGFGSIPVVNPGPHDGVPHARVAALISTTPLPSPPRRHARESFLRRLRLRSRRPRSRSS